MIYENQWWSTNVNGELQYVETKCNGDITVYSSALALHYLVTLTVNLQHLFAKKAVQKLLSAHHC